MYNREAVYWCMQELNLCHFAAVVKQVTLHSSDISPQWLFVEQSFLCLVQKTRIPWTNLTSSL